MGNRLTKRFARLGFSLVLLAAALPSRGFGYQIVTEGSNVACEEMRLSKELKIFKDPTLFLSTLSLIYQDPVAGWDMLMRENPLLTTVKGVVQLMRLGPTREFRNFGAVAKLYEAAEPRLKVASGALGKHAPIVPIMLCGDKDAYINSLGFVLEADLKSALSSSENGAGLPPSIYPNPVPKLPK